MVRTPAVSFQKLRRRKQKKKDTLQKGALQIVKREIAAVFTAAISSFGRPNRDRADDLTDANAALSQSGRFSAHGLRCMVCKIDYNAFAGEKYFGGFSN